MKKILVEANHHNLVVNGFHNRTNESLQSEHTEQLVQSSNRNKIINLI
jgi:hypothetical protein